MRSQDYLGHGPLVGVTADETGSLFILTRAGELLERHPDGTLESRWQAPNDLVLTDVAALEAGTFALTTTNMGFLLDVATGELTEHFCYEPGDGIREEPPPPTARPTAELSQSLTFDRVSNLLYANPQTIALDGNGEGMFSEVAVFDRVSGDELSFQNLNEADFAAGGLVALGEGQLLYGAGSVLYRGDFWEGSRRTLVDLKTLDITSISGMTVHGQLLYVVDSQGRLSEIELSSLQL